MFCRWHSRDSENQQLLSDSSSLDGGQLFHGVDHSASYGTMDSSNTPLTVALVHAQTEASHSPHRECSHITAQNSEWSMSPMLNENSGVFDIPPKTEDCTRTASDSRFTGFSLVIVDARFLLINFVFISLDALDHFALDLLIEVNIGLQLSSFNLFIVSKLPSGANY